MHDLDPSALGITDQTAINDTVRPVDLPRLPVDLGELQDGGRLELGEVIGRGGMSTIYVGHQTALGRTVAVKVPAANRRQIAAMVAEAIVTGQLEHPGIVPVHALEVDADDRPRMLLKRIEGKSWRDLLEAPAATESQRVEHLRIWLRVCEAVSFAHARGVVHRDIKPDNVMVGSFGEVYLLDWGIAVTIDPENNPRMPRLGPHNATAGTPRYMAPEQVKGQLDAQGPATDVFLLAATLYEVLSGRSIYVGATIYELWAAALEHRIEPLPSSVDHRLAALCMAGLDPDPAARPTAQVFAEKIEQWLEQRPALRLLDEVERKTAALESAAADPASERSRHEAVFEAICSSLTHVGSMLPGDEIATLRGRAAVAIARIALAAGDLGSAERRLASPGTRVAPEVLAELHAAIDAARSEQARRAAEVAQRDPGLGRRFRGRLIVVLGTGWVIVPLLAALAPPPLTAIAAGNMLLGIVGFAVVRLRWAYVLTTVPNRLAMLVCLMASIILGIIDGIGVARGIDPTTVYLMHFPVISAAVGVFTVGIEHRSWWAPSIPIVALIAGLLAPSAIMLITAANNLAIVLMLARAALREPPDADAVGTVDPPR